MVEPITSPVRGTVASIEVDAGQRSVANHALVIIESMKMEHPITVGADVVVRSISVSVGQTVDVGDLLLSVEVLGTAEVGASHGLPGRAADVLRADLAAVIDRHAATLDPGRPAAVDRRARKGRRTVRQNVDDLCDDRSFVEYGALAIAAQRRRRPTEELIERTPADGLVGGIGRVDGQSIVIAAYDETVLAGTQGMVNHLKKDRLFALAAEQSLPVVLFAEGGGGRPGDVDAPGVSGLDVPGFQLFARLAGQVPLIGIVAGYCFAGNAALLGTCDVVIATRDSNIGMGGPAMIEGGGLGVVEPTDIGPIDRQARNGVVDVVATDEMEAVAIARSVLGLFGNPMTDWSCGDQTELRDVVPENRRRTYDIRRAIDLIADHRSVVELRREHAPTMVACLARLAGRPVGILANDPMHLGGAIDAAGCDKAADFLELCDRFGLPVISLCDTPGFMVGPEAENEATVRRAGRFFRVGANLHVPICMVVLRKAYGLGAQAMAGGSLKVPMITVAWPTGEFGGMGLEGAVRLGFRRELEAIDDPDERAEAEAQMIALAYERGGALNIASHFEIDDVIDPADTRRLLAAVLESTRWTGASTKP